MSIIYPNNGNAGGNVYPSITTSGNGVYNGNILSGGILGGGYSYPNIITTGPVPQWNTDMDNIDITDSFLKKVVFDATELKKKFSGIDFNPRAELFYLPEIDITKALLRFCNFWEEIFDFSDYGVSLDKECVAFNTENTKNNFKINWDRYLEFYKNSNITSDYPTIHFDYNGTYIADKEKTSHKDDWKWIFLNIEKTAKRERNGWVFEELSDAVLFKMWRG